MSIAHHSKAFVLRASLNFCGWSLLEGQGSIVPTEQRCVAFLRPFLNCLSYVALRCIMMYTAQRTQALRRIVDQPLGFSDNQALGFSDNAFLPLPSLPIPPPSPISFSHFPPSPLSSPSLPVQMTTLLQRKMKIKSWRR